MAVVNYQRFTQQVPGNYVLGTMCWELCLPPWGLQVAKMQPVRQKAHSRVETLIYLYNKVSE